jgi:hypothetical protein
MSYGIDPVGMYRQSASYVDRILRGANPTDLPVEAPTKYQTARGHHSDVRRCPLLTQSGHEQSGTADVIDQSRLDEQGRIMLVPIQRRSNAAFDPYSGAPRVPNF